MEDISKLTNSVGTAWLTETFSAIFIAKAVFPMLGRAARMTSSELCRPPVNVSRSAKPVSTASEVSVPRRSLVNPLHGVDQHVIDHGHVADRSIVQHREHLLFGKVEELLGFLGLLHSLWLRMFVLASITER